MTYFDKETDKRLEKKAKSLPGSPCLGPASFQLHCGYPVREGSNGSAVNEVPDRA